jgi:hypothetical protein
MLGFPPRVEVGDEPVGVPGEVPSREGAADGIAVDGGLVGGWALPHIDDLQALTGGGEQDAVLDVHRENIRVSPFLGSA